MNEGVSEIDVFMDTGKKILYRYGRYTQVPATRVE